MEDKSRITIALAGNPNSGKTTLFNAITGQRQHVGNYPGVTVELKEGFATYRHKSVQVVDLPGTYSLTPYSVEEVVARNFILDQRPDVVVDIVDASNLQRNLYLAVQLMELATPLVLALNMSDLAEQRGVVIDAAKLSALLGVPIVQTVGHKQGGVDELVRVAIETARDGASAVAAQRPPIYGSEIEPHVEELTRLVSSACPQARPRWTAIRLIEGDDATASRLERICPRAADELVERGAKMHRHIESVCGGSTEVILADRRYGYIAGACKEAVQQPVEGKPHLSDRIDKVLTHPWLGLPIFALAMFMVFQITFWLGNPVVELLDQLKGGLADYVRASLEGQPLLQSLLADGLIEGVGAVLVFLPLILLLFLAIALLEDSGYMPRAAYVLDHLMHRVGLHGKSFIPMLVGFGCTVPAILATRMLETRRDRLTTMMVLPLMSCGARLPVYMLILGAFFPPIVLAQLGPVRITNQALLLLAIYVIGIVLAIVFTRILRSTLLRGDVTPFVLELPPYRLPTARGLAVHMIEPAWHYVKKAGTLILAIVIVMWALKTFPRLDEQRQQAFEAERIAARQVENLDEAALVARIAEIESREHQAALKHSVVGRLGHAIEPAMRPAGFDWKISTAMIGAFAAKEVFVGEMGVIYAVGEAAEADAQTLREKLRADYSQLQGFCIMLFILIASPCMATVAATIREASWRWALLQWTYLTVLAWAITAAVFQVGVLLGG